MGKNGVINFFALTKCVEGTLHHNTYRINEKVERQNGNEPMKCCLCCYLCRCFVEIVPGAVVVFRLLFLCRENMKIQFSKYFLGKFELEKGRFSWWEISYPSHVGS